MKLDEFHILNGALGPVNHGNTIAGRNLWIRGRHIGIPQSARSHNRDLCKKGIYLLLHEIGHISSVTLYILKTPLDLYPEMMLSQYLNCKVMLVNLNVGMIPYLDDQSVFYHFTGLVLGMKDPVLGVSALLGKVVGSILILVEGNTYVNQVLNPLRGFLNNHPDNFLVAYPVTGNQGIPDMLFKIVGLPENCRYATLGILSIGIIKYRFGNNCNFSE